MSTLLGVDRAKERTDADVLGGSDICSVFAGRNTCLPVYRGEIQSRMLGFALDTINDNPEKGLNEPGELICREAFPIQPIGFWPLEGYGHDEIEVNKAKERFKESYFKDNKGIWCMSLSYISE
jgi:acetoacetyl-CoA synthetase